MEPIVSVWTKEDVLESRSLKERILNGDWDALKARHDWGQILNSKRSDYKRGKWGEQLMLLASQIDYTSNELRAYMMFASKIRSFDEFRRQYPMSPPSWYRITHEMLYEERETSDNIRNSSQGYPRKVLNLTSDDPRDKFIGSYFKPICDENGIDESEGIRRSLLLWMDKNSKKYRPPMELEVSNRPKFEW